MVDFPSCLSFSIDIACIGRGSVSTENLDDMFLVWERVYYMVVRVCGAGLLGRLRWCSQGSHVPHELLPAKGSYQVVLPAQIEVTSLYQNEDSTIRPLAKISDPPIQEPSGIF